MFRRLQQVRAEKICQATLERGSGRCIPSEKKHKLKNFSLKSRLQFYFKKNDDLKLRTSCKTVNKFLIQGQLANHVEKWFIAVSKSWLVVYFFQKCGSNLQSNSVFIDFFFFQPLEICPFSSSLPRTVPSFPKIAFLTVYDRSIDKTETK